MGRFLALLVSAAALPIASAAPALASETSAPAEAQARVVKARELVALVNPFDAVVAKNMQAWEAGIGSASTLNPSIMKIEEQYPGAWEAAIAAARPLARSYVTKLVGEMMESKARLFAGRLSSAELDQGIAFFTSDPGKRFIQKLFANADPSTLASEVAANAAETGKVNISEDAVNKLLVSAVRKTADASSADDQIAFMRFGQLPAATKMSEAGAEADRMMLERSNNPDPAWLRRQGELLSAAMIQFVDRKKAK